MEMKTHGLSHIHIGVQDLERSLRFYGAFGFQKVAEHDDLHFLVRPGTSDVITLRLGGEHEVDHFGFMLQDPKDLDSAIAELERRGGKLIERMLIGPNVPSAILTDPDGYRIQI